MFKKSGSMGFVIQIVAGKAPPRPRIGPYSAAGGNAARRDLGAKTAITDFLNTA